MNQTDKKILEARIKNRIQTHQSIYDEYTMIGTDRYTFDWQVVVNKRIHIMLPTSFIDLPLEIARLRYPSEFRPKVIKSSMDTCVNFAFLYGNAIKEERQVINLARMYAAAIHRLNPGYEFQKSGTFYAGEEENKLISWYEYISPSLNDFIYNCNGFMRIEKNLMQVVFNCPQSRAEEWKQAVLEVFQSLYGDMDMQLH